MNPQIAYPDYSEDKTQFGNLFPFKEGFVFAWTESKLIEVELQIFRRFTSVLSLTYRRYMDLKETKARAREAEQQASLDRVRAEIASMRTTDDLEKITPLIWRELTTLGVPFFRCGVFIIDEPNGVAHAYLSTPLGKSLAALHVKIDNTWLENAVNNWRRGKIYHEVWNREQFIAWTQTMMAQGFVENKEHFQAGKEAPETLSLQLLPFTQGMLYVGSELPLSNGEIKIAEKLAKDFGVAYSRYEDFQKLEAANHRKTTELEEARQLQLSMLPKELPTLPNLDIAVYMKTATEVGGDYYDFNVGADGTLTVAIGDATGHGMKAGTIVSMIKALFASNGSKMDMKTYFKQSSDALKGIELGRLMMAFLMLRINSNKLHFANAAMPPVYIYKKQSKDVEEVLISGMPLGAMRNFPYQIKELDISSGDTILLLSDGLPELKNGKDEHYGYNRVKGKFKSVAEQSPDDIVRYLKNSAADWVNGSEPDDDITFVVIKIR
jgi:serine phosphatase RsbU (regulator of sigma subunit)